MQLNAESEKLQYIVLEFPSNNQIVEEPPMAKKRKAVIQNSSASTSTAQPSSSSNAKRITTEGIYEHFPFQLMTLIIQTTVVSMSHN